MIWLQYFQQIKQKIIIIKNINDPKLENFDNSLHAVLLNLAKRIAADGEGASKFITIKCKMVQKHKKKQKKLLFQLQILL